MLEKSESHFNREEREEREDLFILKQCQWYT
jgi:hypothetical protein